MTQGPSKSETAAYQKALRRLARQDQTQQQLGDALRRASFAEEVVRGTIERLVRERYLDDRGFAARFARTGLRHRGLGRNRIRQGLRQRGIGRDQAEAGLAEALDDVSEGASLEALARRYWRQRQRDDPVRRLRKLWVFLVRRGYPAGLVAERLRGWWPRWEDALDGLEPPEDVQTEQKDD